MSSGTIGQKRWHRTASLIYYSFALILRRFALGSRFIAQELLTGDMAAVDGCRRKIDDIRACVRLAMPSFPVFCCSALCASCSKLKAAESKHRKYKRACGDQRVSQPPEWVDALEARLTPSVGTASAIVHSGHKRSTADKNTGVDVDKLQQLQRPFKSPKVE